MEETSTHKLTDSDSKLADKGYNIKDTTTQQIQEECW